LLDQFDPKIIIIIDQQYAFFNTHYYVPVVRKSSLFAFCYLCLYYLRAL